MRVHAPGRVNLIGDHVDYVGGVVFPMAVDLGTTIEFEPVDDALVELVSDDEPEPVTITLPALQPAETEPAWGRYVAGVLSEMAAPRGLRGRITSTVPIGAGMSSSSSLAVAVALAAGFEGSPVELARLCRRGETAGSAVPGGIMDQLTIAAAEEGAALRIDCRDETFSAVALPEGVEVHAVHCGVDRRLVGSPYAERRASCEAAEGIVGPLRDASVDAVARLDDPVLRRRARHVVTEIARVEAAVDACRAGDPGHFGDLMTESHASLRDDFEVSIPELDALVDRLVATPGVYGARLTGAGFGGCAVALVDEAVDAAVIGGWRVRPAAGARVLD